MGVFVSQMAVSRAHCGPSGTQRPPFGCFPAEMNPQIVHIPGFDYFYGKKKSVKKSLRTMYFSLLGGVLPKWLMLCRLMEHAGAQGSLKRPQKSLLRSSEAIPESFEYLFFSAQTRALGGRYGGFCIPNGCF